MKADSTDRESIFGWLDLLDSLDYYELLGAEASDASDDLRMRFHQFADRFHPDAHPGRPADERDALDVIFKRGTEAYTVLSDPNLRHRYDAELSRSTTASVKPPRLSVMPRGSQAPPKLEDQVRAPSARPFARKAEELVEKSDFRQAKLQMVLAQHMDPENDALARYMKFIEEEIARRK